MASSTSAETGPRGIKVETFLDDFNESEDKEKWLQKNIPLILKSDHPSNFITLYRYLERPLADKLDLRWCLDLSKKLNHGTVNNVTTFILDQIKESIPLKDYYQLLDETLWSVTGNIVLARDLIRKGARLSTAQKEELVKNSDIGNHLRILFL